MNNNNVHDDFDDWDCLYCKNVTTCPFGRAVIEKAKFSRLTESCPVRINVEWDALAPSVVKEALKSYYGSDSMADTQEFTVFTKIHRS
jgi:hypothetical protein